MKSIYLPTTLLLISLLISLGFSNSQAQCTTCSFTATTGGNFNLTGNQTLCVTGNTGDFNLNVSGAGNKICVANGATWTSSGMTFSADLTIDVYGTVNVNGSVNINNLAKPIINVNVGATMNTNTSGFTNGLAINNAGHLNFTSTGAISNQGSFTLINSATGVVSATATSLFTAGQGSTFYNSGTMTFSNLENSESDLRNLAGGLITIGRYFYNHGNLINESQINTICGSFGSVACEFIVGDKGPGKTFTITNTGCMSVTGNTTFNGPVFINGTLEITGNLTLNKQVSGTNGRIIVNNGVSTISLSGGYNGTTMKFCDKNTAGNGFDVVQANNQSTTVVYTVDCSPNLCTSAPSPVCSISASAQISCHNNGTLADNTDDYLSILLTPYNATQGSYFTLTATQGGSPLNLSLSDESSFTALTYAYPTPLRTPVGSAGNGNIILTLTDVANTTCTHQFTLADPGNCAVTACAGSNIQSVSYSYRTPFLLTDLDNVSLLLPQFNDPTKTLVKAELSYGLLEGTNLLLENTAATAVTYRATVSSDVLLTLGAATLLSPTLSYTTGTLSLPAGITVNAQGTYGGDLTYSAGPNVSTLEGMKSWLNNYMLGIFVDPRTDPRWVTNATGNAVNDDDIYVGPVRSLTAAGTSSFTSTADLSQFIGAGLVPLAASTLSGIASSGGGGNVVARQNTKAYAYATVTYSYSCNTCTLALSATPGSCDPATNQYILTGTVSFTNTPGGTLTIADDGANTPLTSTTVSVPANASSVSFTLPGILSGGRLHTLTATFSNSACGTQSLTYVSPASCTAMPCTGANLLQNPSFEQGFPVPPNGQLLQGPPPSWVGGTADNNPNSTFAAPDGYAFGFSGDNGGTLCQTVPATAGNTYNLKFYAGVHVVNGQTVTLSFLNSSSAVVGTPQTFTITHLLGTGIFGGPYSLSGVAPSGATQVQVCAVSGIGAGFAYWAKIDNFCLTSLVNCGMAVSVSPPACNTVTNQYTAAGTVSLTSTPASSLTISDNGTVVAVVSVTAGQSTAGFSVTGLSNASNHTITVSSSNSTCGTASITYTAPAACTVCSTSITTSALASGTVGQAYSQTIAASGGTAPYAYTIQGGTLPAGLTLNASTGVISGTPASSGSTSFTIRVSDAKSCSDTQPLSVIIAPQPVCGLALTVTPGLCQSATNTYTLSGQVSATNVPASTTLTVSSAAFTPAFSQVIPAGSSSGSFSFSGLISNAQVFTVTTAVSNTACTPVSQTYAAPASCSVAPPCSVSLAVSKGDCNSLTNAYSVTATLTAANVQPPRSVTLDVAGQTQVFSLTATGTNIILFTANGLASDGTNKTATATFSGSACQSTSVTYTAPAACTVCSFTATPTAGLCQTATNTFSSTVVVAITNTGTGGVLTITDGIASQTLLVGASLNNFNGIAVFAGIPSDGAVRSVTVSLPGCSSLTTSYSAPVSCSIAPALASLGNFVFEDVNKDGLQDAGDLPIAGAVVTLLQNGSAVATTTTSASGLYSFTGLTPGIPYSVSFTTPAGFQTSTSANIGSNDAIDSDPVGGVTAPVTLTAGENNPTLDAGFVRLQPQLDLHKKVSSAKAQIGQVISYTVSLVNSGPVAATSIVVSDTYSVGLTIVPGSATASLGSFTPGLQGGTWAIASLPANATATLVFSASVSQEGILFNTASIPGDTAQVCTSVPFRVCAGSAYGIKLSAPAGYQRYQWLLTSPGSSSASVVADGPLNSFTATQPGEYAIIVDNGLTGTCSSSGCCSTFIEEVSVPSYSALAGQPTCVGTTPQANGQITLTGLGVEPTQYVYQLSTGSSFSAATATAAASVPASGVVGSNLSAGTYTVRVSILINGEPSCPKDVTVTLAANCECPQTCVPITVYRIRL